MRKTALLLCVLATTTLLAQTETAVLKLPGMEKVDVRTGLRYDGERTLDLYRPPNAHATWPLVIFVNGVGLPDLKDWGQYTSWPRLAASRGMAAITYQTNGEGAAAQTAALLKYVREHASELKIHPDRIALWACSANVRVATALIAEQDFRAAALWYGIMSNPPKRPDIPVFVVRAGLDTPAINDSIDRWVAQAVALEAPVTLISYPQGPHGFDVLTDTPESRAIIGQTLDFLHFHLHNPRPTREPLTPAQLSRLIAESGIDAGLARLAELRKSHPNAAVLQEQSLNFLGYGLLNQNKPADAVKVLELAVAMNPDSANAHDSLGDAYEAAGRAAEAIAASEKALALLEKTPEGRRAGIRESAEGKLKRLRK
jgi:acetyl esterase/lipase